MVVANRSACAFCKLHRRKCDAECVLAPHFPRDGEKGKEKEKQALNVNKVFGYDRVNKALKRLDPIYHSDVISSITFSAEARVRDPVNGCLSMIQTLLDDIDLYSRQLGDVYKQLSDIKLAQSSPQASLNFPVLDSLSDQIPHGGVNNEIEIGQAQTTVHPPPYRVGDNQAQAQAQAQAPQVFFDFLGPVPQFDLSGQIPYDGVGEQIGIGLEPTPNDVDDQIAIGLEPTSYDGVDDQIEKELEPKRIKMIHLKILQD